MAFFFFGQGGTTRRRFLVGSVFALGSVAGRLGAETAKTRSAEALPEALPDLVRQRERLEDAMAPFRRGGSEALAAAMRQYAEVFAEFAPDPPPRLRALAWALSQYADPAARSAYAKARRHPHVDGSVTSFGKDTFKCNKLVADAYAFGAETGLSSGPDWFSEGEGTGWPAEREGNDLWPPRANTLADPLKNLRSLTDARPLNQPGEDKAKPGLGDLIAFPSEKPEGGRACPPLPVARPPPQRQGDGPGNRPGGGGKGGARREGADAQVHRHGEMNEPEVGKGSHRPTMPTTLWAAAAGQPGAARQSPWHSAPASCSPRQA